MPHVIIKQVANKVFIVILLEEILLDTNTFSIHTPSKKIGVFWG